MSKFSVFILILFSISAFSQNVTSPYSILGIGDVETKDFGRYFGMGSTSIAMRNSNTYSFSNPASLTALNTRVLNYDMVMRSRFSRFLVPGHDTFTSVSKDFAVRRISLAYKPSKTWAFAFGLRPYSTVNYLLSDSGTLAGSTNQINKSVDGNGGLYQVYLTNAFQLNKNFSAGITLSDIFGSLEANTTYTSDEIDLNITRNEYDALHAGLLTGGLQYSGKINRHISQQIGVVVSNAVKLEGVYSTEYITSDSTITDDHAAKHISLPLHIGVGYALILNEKITLSADYNFYNWRRQDVNYPKAYIDDAQRISAGVEYQFKKRLGLLSVEKSYLQAGFSYETGYLRIENKPLNDYSFSFGFGNNVSRLFGYYAGFEFGTKGSINYNQIKEKYTQLVFGLFLKDFMFNTGKYRRYQ